MTLSASWGGEGGKNKIGDEGAKAIAEALKTNTTLKELSLRITNTKLVPPSYYVIIQEIKLETKEPKQSEKH